MVPRVNPFVKNCLKLADVLRYGIRIIIVEFFYHQQRAIRDFIRPLINLVGYELKYILNGNNIFFLCEGIVQDVDQFRFSLCCCGIINQIKQGWVVRLTKNGKVVQRGFVNKHGQFLLNNNLIPLLSV